MKKIYLVALSFVVVLGANAQNSLLTNPTTGQLYSTGSLTEIELVSNGTDVVLIAANQGAKEFYAIDITDNNPADAAANTVTTIPNFQALMDGAIGATFNLINFEVNPISKAVYVLGNFGATSYIVKIEDNGATVTVLDQSNMTFSKIDWASAQFTFQDMTWGDNTLYVTSGSWSLDGEIAWVSAPFVHNSTTTNRATTMFKTNWGAAYFTDAPLETMDFAYINGENRLLGVTVCAPGFSIETSTLPGAGVLQVTEDFNVRFDMPQKCVHQENTGKHWLYNLHSGSNILMRVGEEYLDGSAVTNNTHNANVQHLRTATGTVTGGLVDDQMKLYTENYDMIAFWDNYNLLVLESDVLKLFPTGSTGAGVDSNNEIEVSVFPNPSDDIVNLSLTNLPVDAQIVIQSIDGKEVMRKSQLNSTETIDVSKLSSGVYIIKLVSSNTELFSDKLIIK